MTYTYYEDRKENIFQICVNGEAFDEILVDVIEPSFVFNSSMEPLGIYAIYCDTGETRIWTGISAKDAKKDLYEAIKSL